MAEQWKQAYKTIYGKSPGKADYTLAPSSVSKEVLKSKAVPNDDKDKRRNLFAPTRLKRPANYSLSPAKKAVKRRAVEAIEEEVEPVIAAAVSASPLKQLDLAPQPVSSPSKSVLLAPIASDTCFKSPTKPAAGSRSTPKKRLMEEVNPSPRKPLTRKVVISYADTLYETKSPIKKAEEKPNEVLFEDLQAIDEQAQKDANPKVYRKKNSEHNFLKLNMKKGYQVKGKLTAEQKRKFKKKANLKKFKAGQ